MAHKVMLLCGILSSLLYIGTDILGAVRYKDYSYTAQTISELSAIGAPTRSLVVPRFLAYAVLVIAFGVGVWRSAGPKQALRIVGGLLVGYEVVSLAGPFTPMHRREVLAADGVTLTDTLHKLGAMVDTLFILLGRDRGLAEQILNSKVERMR